MEDFNILYYLASIGNNNYKIKQSIFFSNIKKISENLGKKIDTIINIYTPDDDFEKEIKKCLYINNSYIYNKKGILCQLFKNNPYNHLINCYDYVIFIVDDVEIKNINLKEMIKIKIDNGIDILSPKILNCTHDWLLQNFRRKNTIRITNSLEFYFYFVDAQTLIKIFSLHDEKNPFLWGVDFLLGHFGFKSSVLSEFICEHRFRHLDYSLCNENALTGMNYFLDKHGFKNLEEVKSKYKPIIKELYY